MTINVNVWWFVVGGLLVAIYGTVKFVKRVSAGYIAQLAALARAVTMLNIQLSDINKRLEGAENIGGYLAGLQRVAESLVDGVKRLTTAVEVFEEAVFKPPVTSGTGRATPPPIQEPTDAAATLEFFTQQFQRDGMKEEEARHHAILETELATQGGTPGY